MGPKKQIAYIDFEGRSLADLKKVGAIAYAQHATTEITCLCWAINDGPVQLWHRAYPDLFIEETALPLSLFDHIQARHTVEAHNAGFERAIWENICVPQHHWPSVRPDQWQCSAAKAAVMALPRNLEDACIVLDLPVQKDMEGNRIMLKLGRGRRVTKKNKAVFHEDYDDLQRLWKYCETDVHAERLLSEALPDLIPAEKETWLMDQEMNFRGITVDTEFVDSCIIHQAKNVEGLTDELYELTDGQVPRPTMRDKFITWSGDNGYPLENTQGDYLDFVLENATHINPKVRRGVEIFKEAGKTSISKYESFQARTCKDGRVRDNLVYHGARPGRWAGKGTQLQNLPTGSIEDMDRVCSNIKVDSTDFLIEMYGPIPKLLSDALRGALTASEGKLLYVADFAAIEARAEFWLVDDKETLQQFRDGVDIYKAMAATIYGIPIDQVTKNQRFIGKQAILGLGYQMWAPKFMDTALNAGKKFGISVKLDEEFCKQVVLSYRNKYVKIVNFWKSLENAAILAIQNRGEYFRAGKIQFSCGGKFLRMRLPSGRSISYFQPQVIEAKGPRGLRLQVRYKGTSATTHNWIDIDTFGGKLAENATQGVARDFMVEGMKQIEKTGRYDLLLTVHDEIIAEATPSLVTLEEYEGLMSYVPDWAPDMPLKVEGWEGFRYKK